MERYCGGSSRRFGYSPLPRWADFDAVLWEPTEKPQRRETKPLQTAWRMDKVKFGLLGGNEYI